MDIGEKAPNFSVPDQDGNMVQMSDFQGKSLILFFYPRDDTTGCTKEAVEFSTSQDTFKALGYTIYGVSKDSPKSHLKFINKHELTVPLLSDENTDLCELFGVWKEKSMYGKTFMGIERSTFAINAKGIIEHKWSKVKVPGHVEAVLTAISDG